MSYDFAAVSRDKTILALYATSPGNSDVLTVEILSGIEPNETQATREKGQSRFFVIHSKEGLNFIVGGSFDAKASDAFSFLQNLQRKFLIQYSRNWKNAQLYGMQQEFGPQIKQMIENTHRQAIETIQSNIEETQEIMTRNFEQALLRESTLSEMESKAQNLTNVAATFELSARAVKRKLCWEKYRYYVIGVSIIVIVLFLIIVISCGGFSFSQC